MGVLFEFSKVDQMRTLLADYAIMRVHHEGIGVQRHIVALELSVYNGFTLGTPGIWQRQDVIRFIKVGRTFMTIYRPKGTWEWGAKVEIVTINGTEYLRTDRT